MSHSYGRQALANGPRTLETYIQRPMPNESIHGSSDFFDTYTGYTEQTPSGTAVWQKSRGGLSCIFDDQSNAHVAATLKAIPGGPPLTIESLFYTQVISASNPGAGICFTDGTSASSNITGFGDLSNFGATSFTGTLNSGGANSHQTFDRARLQQGFVIVRLIWKSSNTFAFAYSLDGDRWTDFAAADVSDTQTPTHMGMWVTTWTQTVPQLAVFRYFRVYLADLSV